MPDRRIAPQSDRRKPCGQQSVKPAYSCFENQNQKTASRQLPSLSLTLPLSTLKPTPSSPFRLIPELENAQARGDFQARFSNAELLPVLEGACLNDHGDATLRIRMDACSHGLCLEDRHLTGVPELPAHRFPPSQSEQEASVWEARGEASLRKGFPVAGASRARCNGFAPSSSCGTMRARRATRCATIRHGVP